MFLSSSFTYADRFVQIIDVPNLSVYVKLRIINEYSHFLKYVSNNSVRKTGKMNAEDVPEKGNYSS